MRRAPPTIDGLAASRLQLPPGPWATVLDGLCARFPLIDRVVWLDRMERGRVVDDTGSALDARAPYIVGADIHYFREVSDEAPIPFEEAVLHADEHLVVADKPHFLPVTPAGRFVRETLLGRLRRRLGNPGLVPLHRIDRATAGLVLFSANPATRALYHALFSQHRIVKRYEALAPALADGVFPLVRRSRLVVGKPFFRMREAPGSPNSETRIDVIESDGDLWRYALEPVTGRKHQLRVHMAALGAPICNDGCYPDMHPDMHPDTDPTRRAAHHPAFNPEPAEPSADNYRMPLQLLAKTLVFSDPVTGRERRFDSRFELARSADWR